MGFWCFMLAMDLMIPITMIAFGNYFIKHAPKKINAAFGYRTSRSMRSREAWEFAHHYIGKLWRIWGIILLPVSAAAILFFIDRDIDTVAAAGTAICFAQLLPMIGSIFPTERALKQNFSDKQ